MISSNTIVRNGMPFIGKVLEQVAPYMDKMIITLSVKCTDDTLNAIRRIVSLYKNVILDFEDVDKPDDLTDIRNKQIGMTNSDWILFLDDDDYWPKDQLKLCLQELNKDSNILAYSVNPYQLLDFEHYDISWKNKSFSKFLQRKDLQYRFPWPKDLPCDKDGKPLYWKTHSQVKCLPYRFYHLSYLKDWSFRNQEWAEKWKFIKGQAVKLPTPLEI